MEKFRRIDWVGGPRALKKRQMSSTGHLLVSILYVSLELGFVARHICRRQELT